jgi:hypothetical protein
MKNARREEPLAAGVFLAKKEIPHCWQRGILTQTNKHKNYLLQF